MGVLGSSSWIMLENHWTPLEVASLFQQVENTELFVVSSSPSLFPEHMYGPNYSLLLRSVVTGVNFLISESLRQWLLFFACNEIQDGQLQGHHERNTRGFWLSGKGCGGFSEPFFSLHFVCFMSFPLPILDHILTIWERQ